MPKINSNKMVLYFVKIITLYNAIILGWNIQKIEGNTYELSKEIVDDSNLNLGLFLNQIVPNINL